MWFKRVSELWDIAMISEIKWHTDLSGCYKAPFPSDFRSLVAQNLSSNKNIAIVGTLDGDSVVAGTFFCRFILSRQIDGNEPRRLCNRQEFFIPLVGTTVSSTIDTVVKRQI